MDGHGKTILVAEDHESNRKLLALLLEQAQYAVHLAADGHASLDRMLNGVFDAVIMDWDMPGLNGSKFLAPGQTLCVDTPVIMVSAHTINPGEGIHQRAFAWLRKPYNRMNCWRSFTRLFQQPLIGRGSDPSSCIRSGNKGIYDGSNSALQLFLCVNARRPAS